MGCCIFRTVLLMVIYVILELFITIIFYCNKCTSRSPIFTYRNLNVKITNQNIILGDEQHLLAPYLEINATSIFGNFETTNLYLNANMYSLNQTLSTTNHNTNISNK